MLGGHRALLPAAVVLGLLAAGLPLSGVDGAGAIPGPEWWGPTEVGKGFHIRIPVTVTNTRAYPVSNGPVAAELDLAAELLAAGWIGAPSGDRQLLKSFRLDEASVRVISMTDLEPRSPGTPHGRLNVFDGSLPASNLARYEVPSRFLPGFLRNETEPFDASVNPAITVVWRVPGTLQPGEKRYFMIYLDTLTNLQHASTSYETSLAGGSLESLFWSGPGLTLYGTVNPAKSQSGTVLLVGLHDNTTVEIFVAAGSGTFSRLAPTGSMPNPFQLGRHQYREVVLSSGTSANFKVRSDKPVLGLVASSGFVPSLDSGMAGREFIFAHRRPQVWEQDTVYFASTSQAPTVVRVEPLAGGAAIDFHLNDAQNPYPYTPAARGGPTNAADGPEPCRPQNPQAPTPMLPAGPGLYKATVVSGDAVLLQLQPSDGLFQAPSIQGAPAGRRFYAATGWTDFIHFGGAAPRCDGANRGGAWFSAGVDGPTAIKATSPERQTQIEPPGVPNQPAPPPRPVGFGAPNVTGPHTASFFDRPLLFDATAGPAWLWAGNFPPQTDVGTFAYPNGRPSYGQGAVPTLNGPLGGVELARRFTGMGPTVVFAPFNHTLVRAELDYSATGPVRKEVRLGADGISVFDDVSGFDRLVGITLEADRPVLAYPMLGPPGFLSAVPAFLVADTGLAEYRGYLVDLSSPTGLEPLTGSTLPGAPITYTLSVTNRARAEGGLPIADTVDLSLTAALPKWKATLDRASVTLEGGQSQDIHLILTPDADIPPGNVGAITVEARSQGNPRVYDTFDTVTFLKRSFDVGLWFHQVGGRKTLTQAGPAGSTIDFDLVLQNKGSVPDRVQVLLSDPEPGWQSVILRDGKELSETISLAPTATTNLTLRVVSPSAAGEGLVITTVTASSLSSPAALDRVTATTKVAAPSDLELNVTAPTRLVNPGQEALFPLVLRNKGQGGTEVLLETQAVLPANWSAPRIFVEDPITKNRIDVQRVSVGAGDVLSFWVSVTPPPTALAATGATLRLSAGPETTSERLDAFLFADVKAVHLLQLGTPPLPLEVRQAGQNLSLEVRLTNRGNLDERLAPRVSDLPPGWKLETPADLYVARNGTQSFTAFLTAATDAPVGRYNVTLELVSQDGNRTRLLLPTTVGAVARERLAPPDLVLAQPGRTASTTLDLLNEGNTALNVRVEPDPSEPWTLGLRPPTLSVLPNARANLALGWDVPVNAPHGPGLHRARVVLRPEISDAVETVRVVEVPLDVGRAELRIVTAETYPGIAGTLVRVQLANDGNRSAYSFAAQLQIGRDVVDEVLVEELPAGGRANLSFLRPGGREGTSSVVLDGPGLVVEADETNNQLSLDDAQRGGGVPAAGFLAVCACLAAGFLGILRRVHRRPPG